MSDQVVCRHCGGTGFVPDNRAIGLKFRAIRLAHRKTFREVAEMVGLSAAYVNDLERGNRNWHAEVLARFEAAFGEPIK